MKRYIKALLALGLSAVVLAGCTPDDRTGGGGEEIIPIEGGAGSISQPTPNDPQEQPDIATAQDGQDEEQPVELRLARRSYPLDSEEIGYTIKNNEAEPVMVVIIPTLERLIDGGWVAIPPENVGFCGTPDTIEDEFEYVVPLEWYRGSLEAGTYRLSFSMVEEKNYEHVGVISAEFELN